MGRKATKPVIRPAKDTKGSPFPSTSTSSPVAETETGKAIIVAWMLFFLSTVAAEALGFGCQLLVLVRHPVPVPLAHVVAMVMLFVALVAGSLSLGMLPIVLRWAQRRPPNSILITTALAGLLPWLTLTLMQWRK